MKFFTKKETFWLLIILAVIVSVSLYNFGLSLRRARDAQRKADLGAIANALNKYQDDFGFYPPSLDGKIVACERPGGEINLPRKKTDSEQIDLMQVFRPCVWGEDGLRDVFDPEYPPYLKVLPTDPHSEKGVSYRYFSNESRFQIYAALEGQDEDQSQKVIAQRNLSCGERVCNFGKASGETPLDKSIEEYENELLERKKLR